MTYLLCSRSAASNLSAPLVFTVRGVRRVLARAVSHNALCASVVWRYERCDERLRPKRGRIVEKISLDCDSSTCQETLTGVRVPGEESFVFIAPLPPVNCFKSRCLDYKNLLCH